MTSTNEQELAQVKIHPAVIVVGCFMIGLISRDTWTLTVDPETLLVLQYTGLTLEIVGVLTLVLSYSAMARSRTTINPSEHSSMVVTSGIYAWSRNPIYVGWFVFIAGMGLRNASLFVLVLAVVMILLLYWAVVLEEEKYLESRFGEEYLRYKRSVRRWL